MPDVLTLVQAFRVAMVLLEKFVEGAGTKLGELAIEQLPNQAQALIQKLGQLLWDRGLKDHPQGRAVLEAAAQGQEAELREVVKQVLEGDGALREEVQQLAQAVYQDLSIEQTGQNVMNVLGGQGLQVNANQEQPIIQIQGNPTLNFGVKEKK